MTSPSRSTRSVVERGKASPPWIVHGPSSKLAVITCQMGSMQLVVAPSSKTRRRNVPERSVWRRPGRNDLRVVSMASSVVRCASRTQEISSGVLSSLQGPSTLAASDHSTCPRARRMGWVSSSIPSLAAPVKSAPSASTTAPMPSSRSGKRGPWRWSAGRSAGAASQYGVNRWGASAPRTTTAIVRKRPARPPSSPGGSAPEAYATFDVPSSTRPSMPCSSSCCWSRRCRSRRIRERSGSSGTRRPSMAAPAAQSSTSRCSLTALPPTSDDPGYAPGDERRTDGPLQGDIRPVAPRRRAGCTETGPPVPDYRPWGKRNSDTMAANSSGRSP